MKSNPTRTRSQIILSLPSAVPIIRSLVSVMAAISAGISGIGFYAEVVVFAEKAEGA